MEAVAGRPSVSAEKGGRRRDERWLARVWERQRFDRHGLQTTCGLSFKVVYPGRRTGEAGPDFHDAILALADGALLRGDVELHLDSAGWQQHGHHRDPAYNRVVLHVVLNAGGPVCNNAGEPVPTLELARRLRSGRAGSRVAETAAAPRSQAAQLSYVVRPCRHQLEQRNLATLSEQLQGLAIERLRTKQAIFEGELAVFEPEQALYGGLMEALGYSRNRAPFRQLAQVVPLAALRSLRGAQDAERLLLAGAGFLNGDEAAESLDAMGLPPPSAIAGWQVLGVRPDNLPGQRIRQFGAVLPRLLPGGLMDELLGSLCEIEAAAVSPLKRVRLLRRQWHAQLAELGPQRADAIAINVLLPFAAAYGQATCQFALAELAADVFLAYPAQGANQVTGYMRRDILGQLASAAAGAAGEQALLHVWDRWCHDKVCALCPLGRRGVVMRES